MSMETYRARTQGVAFELFADDAVLVDFDRGRYYALNVSGRDVWEILGAGPASAAEIARRLAPDAADGLSSVAAFLDRLVEIGLAFRVEGAPVVGGAAGVSAKAAPSPRGAFTPPKVDEYTDLEDLLLLDPIHDVAPDGWPRAAESP